jgi:probable HAF family extracellular repeat protein
MNGASGVRAFLWTPEAGMQALGGSENSNAYAINDNGVIAGYAMAPDGTTRGAVWIDGSIHFLPPGAGVAYDVNSAGEVVGSGSPSVVVNGMPWGTAYIWSAAAGLRTVATLRGFAGSALGINDAGVVVGWGPHATADSIVHAFASSGGSAVDLGIPGVSNSVVMKIAANGLKAGRNGSSPAVLWLNDGSMIELRGPPGTSPYAAEDVNSAGEVAGTAAISTRRGFTRRAVVWRVF